MMSFKGKFAECTCGKRFRILAPTAAKRISAHKCNEAELIYRYAKARGYV